MRIYSQDSKLIVRVSQAQYDSLTRTFADSDGTKSFPSMPDAIAYLSETLDVEPVHFENCGTIVVSLEADAVRDCEVGTLDHFRVMFTSDNMFLDSLTLMQGLDIPASVGRFPECVLYEPSYPTDLRDLRVADYYNRRNAARKQKGVRKLHTKPRYHKQR